MNKQQLDRAAKIPKEVARHLGYYVYLYSNPRTSRPFYVGKGKGQRLLSHMSEIGESRKQQMLKKLGRAGIKPLIEVLAHALPNEETAFRIEAAVIDLLGLDKLTNSVRGWRSIQLGRMHISELVAYYAAKPVTITHPMLLIRINRLYRHNMSKRELYDATRGVWRLGERRHSAQFAAAVFEGVIREVYEIKSWHPAGTTSYLKRTTTEVQRKGRVEFVGRIAPEKIRVKYVDRSVRSRFRRGQQGPVVYVNA
jgi:uncharacterized protein